MTKREVYDEIRHVLIDAKRGRDVENIIKRLSIAVTKLDALAEQHPDDEQLREDVRIFDEMRMKVFKQNGMTAHEVMNTIKSALREDAPY